MQIKNLHVLLVTLIFSGHQAMAQWQETTPPVEHYPAVTVESIDGKLYAATNKGVYSSSDNGTTWNQLIEDGGFKHIFKTTGDTLVATHHGASSVLTSFDNGVNWQYDTVGIYLKGENRTIYYHAADNRILLSLGYPSYGLFYKTPSETQWTRINSNNIGTTAITNVSHITAQGNKIFAAGYKSFYETTDGGLNWTQVTTTGYPNTTDAAHSKSPFISTGDALFLGGEGGIYKSTDDGLNWTTSSTGIINLFLGNPYAPTMFYDGMKIYIGTRGHNDSNFVYTSTDGGLNWQVYNEILPSWPISIIKHNGAVFITRFNQSKVLHDGNLGSSGLLASHEQQNFELFPVPANNFLSVRFKQPAARNFTLHSVTGQKMLEISATEEVVEVNVSGVPSGIYYLQIETSQNTQTQKVVITH